MTAHHDGRYARRGRRSKAFREGTRVRDDVSVLQALWGFCGSGRFW